MQATSATDYKVLFEQERKEKEALKLEMLKMQMQLQKFAQMMFGPSSERFKGKQNDPQLSLDISVEQSNVIVNKEELTEVKAHLKNAKGARKRQLDQLPAASPAAD